MFSSVQFSSVQFSSVQFSSVQFSSVDVLNVCRAQNSFLGGGWKGIASDGRFASDERWRCTNETQLDNRWASDGFDDSSWPRVMYSKAPYTWMCPDYPVEAEWLWVDNYTYLGIVYCRLQILPC
jgi:hypothetical protein